ncbi:DNA mismatch repair endonuclease MutL [Desulfobulbus sp.]|uniref:DNA mismatch repair endonuclease MutL n=1 Tax=Desulfobulbus sp. TaxID=895 RepID=UPI00286F4F6E|nr:DNA mismatch repair endonuclease MutL [Desulfobulbus sp.]
MSRIRILSEQLANQIAAGEVVERPASVVKELLENSLDAGATRIDIQIEDSGSGLLRVADNGAGMDGDDVLLCLERHATSKIREEAQLAAIVTLGFRGEAIPSIASVSWMTILSRPQDQELGTRAEIRYGTLRHVHQDGCGRGTVIEIRHLFGNMPARKKFLKSARTEMHHIEEVVKNQALAHPATGFTLQTDGRTAFDYRQGADLEGRVREVFRYRDKLMPLAAEAAAETGTMALDGFLLLPETAPATAARLRLLVNGRPVQDAMLRHAVNEGMQGFLMKGYQPAGVLRLAVSPDQVDVNVHPAKREIRFRRSEAVHRFVADAIRRAMAGYQRDLRTSLFAPPLQSAPPVAPATADSEATAATWPDFPALASAEPAVPPQPRLPAAPPITSAMAPSGAPSMAPPPPQSPPRLFSHEPPVQTAPAPGPPLPDSPSAAPESGHAGPVGHEYAGLTLIGQLFSLYLLCEREGRFIVIDQHAAHERLLYGQLLQGYLAANIPQQALLFPVTVELSPAQAETLEQRGDEVVGLGFTVEPFGDATWVIKAAPALVGQVEPGELLREILDGLRGPMRGDVARPVPQAVDDLLASMACKAAIKAGNRLQPVEMLKLLAQMEAGAVFSHCPHGRPVLKTFTAQEVERWFHRHGG